MYFKSYLSHILPLFALLSISLIGGCEYQTDNEYKRDVQQPDSAAITINLNPSDSIIYLSGNTRYYYLAVTDSLKCYNVQVFVDTTQISEDDEAFGSFTLNANDYTDGHYVLTIVATTSSGSGSLADILGAEGFLFSFKWDMIVDKSPPSAVQITDIFNNNGILRLEWEKYNKGNFGWYEVVKTTFDDNGNPHSTSLDNVNNIDQNYYDDDTYLGGKVQYQVRVLTPLYKAATSEPKTFIDENIVLHAEWIHEDLVKLSWTKIKYYKAFQELRIYKNSSFIFSTKSADTNSFTGNIGIFGDETLYKLDIFDQHATHWGTTYSKIYFSIGIPMTSYKSFISNNINASVYLATASKLYKFNTDNRIIEDSVAVPDPGSVFVVSPEDNILIGSDPARKINTNNLSVSQPLTMYCKNIGSLSAEALGIAQKDSYWILYDFVNSAVVTTFPGMQLQYKNYMTEDGKYLFQLDITNLICCKSEGGQLIKEWDMRVSSFSLIPGEPDKFMLLKDKTCEIRKIETNQILSTFYVNSYHILGIDATNNTVAFKIVEPTDRIVIYNYITGEKLKDFASNYYADLKYYRGSVYWTNGYEIPLLNLSK